MTSGQGYRDILKHELIERCQHNPKYSLRAFARDLNLAPARLSDILNGKKGLSRAAAEAVARNMGLSVTETRDFCDRVEALHARSKTARELAKNRIAATTAAANTSLTIDAFRAVADWYHFGILQALKLDTYEDSPEWLANALGISRLQATEALSRLERLELIEKKDGKFQVTGANVAAPDGIPSEAIKKFHEQILRKALDALYTQPLSERDFSAHLMPISAQDIALARQRIREFSKKLVKELTSRKHVDRVYSLSVQFINLSPNLKEKNP